MFFFLLCLVVGVVGGLPFVPIFCCKIMLKPDGTKLATIRRLCDELANRININLSLKLV